MRRERVHSKNNTNFEFPHRNTYPPIAHALLDIKQGHFVLEIGCAEGYFSGILSKRAKWVISMDINRTLLLKVKSKTDSGDCRISWIRASAAHLPFKDCAFDRTCSLKVIEHLTSVARIMCLSEVHRTLRKDGVLVLTTPNKGRFLQYIFLDGDYLTLRHKHFSPSEIKAMLDDRGFRIIKLFTSGGILYAFLFYSFFWKSQLLQRFRIFRGFTRLLIFNTEAEFYREKFDGCVVFAQSKRY